MLKLFKYLGKTAWLIILVIMLLIAQAAGDLYIPDLTAEIITNVVTGNVFSILQTGLLMSVITLGIAACGVLSNLMSSLIGVALAKNVRNAVFKKVSGYSLREFDRFGAASLITRTTNDITQVQNVVVMMFRFLIYSPILCVGAIIIAATKNWELTLIIFGAIVLLFALVGFALIFVLPKFKLLQQKLDQLNLVLRENLKGIRVIRAFSKTETEFNRFDKANIDLTELAIKVNKLMAYVFPFAMFIMNITFVVIMWVGGLRVESGSIQIGDIAAFLQYATQIMFSIMMFAIMLVMIPRAQASAFRVNEVLDMTTEIKDPSDGAVSFDENYDVVFEDVTFFYEGAEEPVLKNISFTAKQGQITGIIGGTGSGKSTIINLIPRFYDVSQGKISIGGVDIRSIKQEILRSKMSLTPQTAELFSGSVTENIKLGKQDASDIDVKHAAKIAQADGFIENMQDKYNAYLAQAGTNLSGGQKQRMSIARSVIRHTPIYMFDDTFAALDAKTEAKARDSIKKELKNSVLIIVSQKISAIADADNIIVLDNGKIVGSGTHEYLMKTCDIYQETAHSQMEDVAQ